MQGVEFLNLDKQAKQNIVNLSSTRKRVNENGKTVYYIQETACCKEKVEWLRGEAPTLCPNCKNKYWRLPALEHFLFVEQDKFLKEYPNTDRLGQYMYPLIHDYAINLIQALIKNKIQLDNDILVEKAHDAATQLIEVILKDKDHRMKVSFGGYLKRLCNNVVYSTQDHDKTFSLDSVLKDDEREYVNSLIIDQDDNGIACQQDTNKDPKYLSYDVGEEEDIVESLLDLITQSSDAIYSNTSSLEQVYSYLLGLNLKFTKVDPYALSQFYEIVGLQSKLFIEKGELLIYDYLNMTASKESIQNENRLQYI